MDIDYDLPMPISSLPDIEMTISQYDYSDHEIGRFTGTFTSIFDSINNFENYYYRITSLGISNKQGKVCTYHFGVKTTSIGNFVLTEENFLNSFLNHEIQEYAKQKRNGIITFNFSFAYVLIHDFWYIDRLRTLNQNTSEEFNTALDKFLSKFKQFIPIYDLNNVDNKEGIYLLVLDEYNACYLGQAVNLRNRIMRHWSRNDYFTGSGIDMFKAHDTTRIFIALASGKDRTNSLEHKTINAMPSRYTLNCLPGGDIDYLAKHSFGLSKKPCTDNDFINFVAQHYDIAERIHANKQRFIID